MTRSLIAVAVMASTLLAGPLARAQAVEHFGDKGEFILDADRLMPLLAYSHFSRGLPAPGGATGASQSGDNTTLGLFYGSTLDLNNNGAQRRSRYSSRRRLSGERQLGRGGCSACAGERRSLG